MVMEDDTRELVNGPDQLVTCNNLVTWDTSGSVKIRMERSGFGSTEPISIPGLLMKCAKENPNLPALKIRDPKTLVEKTWTWSDYHQEVRTVAKAFISLGLGRFESVCILGFNSPEWVIADVAAIFAGGLAAGIYPTNGPEAVHYILEQSKCAVLVVEDQKQLDKIWGMRDSLPHLKKIVQYTGTPTTPGVLSWSDVLARGRGEDEELLMARLRRICINHCSTLVYTSGTTGNPKGVMLSHDNITYTISLIATTLKFQHRLMRILSYLPLSHVAAQMVDIHAPMFLAGCTYFADKNVLKSTLLDNLNWCRPTEFLAVPRVWEKIMEKMMEKAKDIKGLKKTVSTKAKVVGLKYHTKGSHAAQFKIFEKIYFSKVKELLGFGDCRLFFSGAAPIDRKTTQYFLSLDIKIMELYGMSESSGPHSVSSPEKNKPGSVGTLLPSLQSQLIKAGNEEVTEDKELMMWGRHVMMGYAHREDATRKDMTEDGWLKSGDLVAIDSEGFHFIVGREKDLIITAGGENVAPQPIHDMVKEQLPVISQVLLLGDKQKFLSCLLTLAVEVDPDTMEPSGRLTRIARDWCRSVGSQASTVQDVLEGPDLAVMRGLQAGIDKANRQAVSNAQRIQKWMVIPKDFSIPGGEMGPTMKVKRIYVTKKYAGCIDKIYNVGH